MDKMKEQKLEKRTLQGGTVLVPGHWAGEGTVWRAVSGERNRLESQSATILQGMLRNSVFVLQPDESHGAL